MPIIMVITKGELHEVYHYSLSPGRSGWRVVQDESEIQQPYLHAGTHESSSLVATQRHTSIVAPPVV